MSDWKPCTGTPPASGYIWEIELLNGVDHLGGVIYWVRKELT